jgi:hypothetical protein
LELHQSIPFFVRPLILPSIHPFNYSFVHTFSPFSFSLSKTCGRGEFGCLGHGDLNHHSKPQLIQELLYVEARDVAVGATHVALVTGKGELYTWGFSSCGALGLGPDKQGVFSLPQLVLLPPNAKPKKGCG